MARCEETLSCFRGNTHWVSGGGGKEGSRISAGIFFAQLVEL